MANNILNVKVLPPEARETLSNQLRDVILEVKSYVNNNTNNSISGDILSLVENTEKLQSRLTADAIASFVEKYVLILQNIQGGSGSGTSTTNNSTISSIVSSIQSELNAIREKHTQDVNHLQNEIDDLAETVSQISGSDITEVSASVDTLKGEVSDLEDRMDTAENDISTLQGSVSGKVAGPSSSTDGNIALFNGTTGKLLKQAPVSIDNTGNITFTTAGAKVDGRDVSADGAAFDIVSNSFDLLSSSYYPLSTSYYVLSSSFADISSSFDVVSSSFVDLSSSFSLVSSSYVDTSSSLDDHIGSGGAAHAVATTSANGFMSSSDKEKLDSIEEDANKTTLATEKPQPVGDFPLVGTSGSVARADHVHDPAPRLRRYPFAPEHFINDWNDAIQNGWYANYTTSTNAPTDTYYVGFVSAWSASYRVQVVFEVLNNKTYKRQYSGGTWSAWVEQPNKITDLTPESLSSLSSDPGSSSESARADHVHAHGDLDGGSLHSVATTSVNGFMSSSDKAKLDGIAEGAVSDHGSLSGLSDDDHPQYFNETRGDDRYTLTSSFIEVSSSFVDVSSSYAELSSSFINVSSSIAGLWSDYTATSSSFDILSSSYVTLSSSFSEVSSSWSVFSSSYDPFVLPDRLSVSGSFFDDFDDVEETGWYYDDGTAANSPVAGTPTALSVTRTVLSGAPLVYQVIYVGYAAYLRYKAGGSWVSWTPLTISLSNNTPNSVNSSAGSAGSGTTSAKWDHVHAHGDLLGGSLHALATTALAGFMSSTDKAKLDGIETGTWSPTYTPVAGLGSLASINRGSHYIRVGSHLLCMCVCRPVNAGTTSNNPRRMTISIPAGYALSGNQYYVGGTISEWTFAVTGNDQATRIGAIGGVTGESSVVHCAWNNTGINSGGSYGIVCLFWCADISKT